jgi:hypothetical protein
VKGDSPKQVTFLKLSPLDTIIYTTTTIIDTTNCYTISNIYLSNRFRKMVVCILYNHIQSHNFHMSSCHKLSCNLIPSNHYYKLEIRIKMFKCLFATLTDFLHNFVPYIPRHSNKFHFPNKFCAFHIWNTIFLVTPHNLCCNIFLHIQVYHKHFHCSHPYLRHSSFYICVDHCCQTELPRKFLKIIGKSSCPQWCFLRLLGTYIFVAKMYGVDAPISSCSTT